MRASTLAVVTLLVIPGVPAFAQTFNQAIVFGDSTVDSGWWKGALAGNCDGAASPCTNGNAPKNLVIGNSIANGGTGAPAGAVLMNSQLLASYFGLTANPANQAGGTNYAISGATDANSAQLPRGNLNPNPNLPSTAQQIANYLASNGGRANSSAFYLISSGGNDLNFSLDNPLLFPTGASRQNYVAGQAAALTTAISGLQAAGARYIIVTNSYGIGNLANVYNAALWSDLAAAGVNFIPADVQAMRKAVQASPTTFGFTAATVSPGVVVGTGANRTSTGSACVLPTGGVGPNTGWGQWCVNTTTPSSQYAYLASSDAQQKYFFADDEHFSAAGQKIEADYIYSLIVAPSQISFLAENAVKTRARSNLAIQNQIDASLQSARGPLGFNAWVTGDVSHFEHG
jgi:outer membrane lipase/esterase